MINRFHVFAGQNYYAAGGWYDYRASYPTMAQAMTHDFDSHDWGHILMATPSGDLLLAGEIGFTAGWDTQLARGVWRLTDAGRAALAETPEYEVIGYRLKDTRTGKYARGGIVRDLDGPKGKTWKAKNHLAANIRMNWEWRKDYRGAIAPPPMNHWAVVELIKDKTTGIITEKETLIGEYFRGRYEL